MNGDDKPGRSKAADPDEEANSLTKRVRRYAAVGARVSGAAAGLAGARLIGTPLDKTRNAQSFTRALGGLKGPIMKVAQLMATIPDALPAEYAAELQKLQADAPPMGPAFVKRRMVAELGPGWESRFGSFDRTPTAAASLGQVHRASAKDGAPLACKLQYPDMQSAVEADLAQLQLLLALHRRMDRTIDTREIALEISERMREELDYGREAGHARLYGDMLRDEPLVRVPKIWSELSTRRLLTMDFLEGRRLLTFKDAAEPLRNRLAEAMFRAWWHPFTHGGVIHGDPHLGNYTAFMAGSEPGGINLLDYGCIRIFPPAFVGGVIDLYRGLQNSDSDLIVHAYETWGFRSLSRPMIEALNMWASFIYAPLLDDRIRTVADGIAPGEYGRKQAALVQAELRKHGGITIPREFVFMDRAAIGLGSVYIHLQARMNWHTIFNEAIGGFAVETVAKRQAAALARAGL